MKPLTELGGVRDFGMGWDSHRSVTIVWTFQTKRIKRDVKGVELTGTEFVTRVRDADQIGRKGFASLGKLRFGLHMLSLR